MAKKKATKSKGGRPRHVPVYREGKEAQEHFLAAMKAIAGTKKGK